MRIEGFLGFGPPYVRWVDYKDMRRRYRQQSELTEAAVAEAAEWKEHAREAVRRELELETARDYWRDRAEAAETERNTAARRAFNAEAENQLLQRELSAAEARAAELEAALAADRAAHQWRPVTEEWPPNNVQLLGRATLNSPTLLVTRTAGIWQNDDGVFLDAGEIGFCAPLPAAPQEPTP